MILHRKLKIRTQTGKEKPVSVRLGTPFQNGTDWECLYEIGWPSGIRRRKAFGVDAIQALMLAMKAVGSELYASEHHASGALCWLETGKGYGFPVCASTMPDLIGDDSVFAI